MKSASIRGRRNATPTPRLQDSGARGVAASVLARVLGQGRSLTSVLPPALAQVNGRERGLVQELCYGVLRWYPQLQFLLDQLLDRPLKPTEPEVRALLLVGLYQLSYLRVPDHAALAETVAASRALHKDWAAGLINAVLRNYQRRRAAWPAELRRDETAYTAHPGWLLQRIQSAWPQDWQAVVAANNAYPPCSLRVNQTRLSRSVYLEQLAAAGIDAWSHPFASAGITLTKPREVGDLPGFRQGFVSVQDQAAQLAAALLDVQPAMRVLDACAAPGGKTCHILEIQPQVAHLLALDADAARLQQVQENLQRLGLQAQVLAGDANTPANWWDGRSFDRILLDAPCSATGVIRRHPDIKVLRQTGDIEPLARRQHALLEKLWPLLAPGGMLVYATCSILPQENESVVGNFLAAHPDARERPIVAPWGHARPYGRQILPGEWEMDGFYYACLVKDA